jgi:hypothetical protein
MDLAWWRKHYDDTHGFAGEKLSISKGARGAAIVDLPYSGNSGAGALILAHHYGARRIIMLGYDCKYAPDGKRHWHGDHPRGLGNAVSVGKWPEEFKAAAGFVADAEVINASRETALSCFPRQSLEDALRSRAFQVRGMLGLGDNIYQRGFIKALPGQVFLETPWPELYRDLPNVKFLKRDTTLRTQKKNADKFEGWSRPPANACHLQVRYGVGIFDGMRDCFGREPYDMDLPDFGSSPVEGDYVVIRPVTVRREWPAESRNPLPEYIAEAAAQMRARGIKVVSVADLKSGHEWALEPLPDADVRFHVGQLPVDQLLALLQHAKAVVGPIGWIVPAALAAKVPGWIVCGGNGGYNAPELITPPGEHSLTFAIPDQYCRCTDRAHRCSKIITQHNERFAEWLDEHFGKSPQLVA